MNPKQGNHKGKPFQDTAWSNCWKPVIKEKILKEVREIRYTMWKGTKIRKYRLSEVMQSRKYWDGFFKELKGKKKKPHQPWILNQMKIPFEKWRQNWEADRRQLPLDLYSKKCWRKLYRRKEDEPDENSGRTWRDEESQKQHICGQTKKRHLPFL